MLDLPTFEDVVAAHQRIKSHVHRTPVLTSRTANKLFGTELFFKCENLQRVGAFKFRGAFNTLSKLSAQQRQAGVVTFSSGNDAQVVALSAHLLGVRATNLMPHDAPVAQMAAAREYGGQIVIYDRYQEDREQISESLEQKCGLTLISPYDHQDVIAGQGTAAKELFENAGGLDALFIPFSGGGLLAGSALAARALSSSRKLYGVDGLAWLSAVETLICSGSAPCSRANYDRMRAAYLAAPAGSHLKRTLGTRSGRHHLVREVINGTLGQDVTFFKSLGRAAEDLATTDVDSPLE